MPSLQALSQRLDPIVACPSELTSAGQDSRERGKLVAEYGEGIGWKGKMVGGGGHGEESGGEENKESVA